MVAGRLFGWELAARVRPRPERVAELSARTGPARFLYRASLNKWWFDELNHLLFIRLGGVVAEAIRWFDERIIDGLVVNGTGRVTIRIGGGLRHIQTGRVQNYALGIALGLLVMAGAFLVIAAR